MKTKSRSNAWDNLPNTKYINFILADIKENPNNWVPGWNVDRDTAYNMALDAAYDMTWGVGCNPARNTARQAAWIAARNASHDAARNTVSDVAWYIIWDAAWNSITALIAWDDCSNLLNKTPKQVRLLAEQGNNAAILLYPACFAFSKS